MLLLLTVDWNLQVELQNKVPWLLTTDGLPLSNSETKFYKDVPGVAPGQPSVFPHFLDAELLRPVTSYKKQDEQRWKMLLL